MARRVAGNNAEWQSDLDQVWIQGNCFHDEIVFFHRQSQTLIVADLCMSGVPEQPLLTRLVLWMLGIYQKPGPPIDVKFAYLNQKVARDSFNKLMEWDFDRMILAHGPLIHTNAKSVLSQAYQFLLG